ncbi:MAG: winged helix DNA-binding domain-containing protein [Candidatus Limnocylindrales bacterium]
MTSTDTLTLRRLNRATLQRQGLIDRHAGSVAEVIGRLAGLQAQHANAPYVALWSRMRDLRMSDLETALQDRSVVKATIMRATLHLVAARDFRAFDAASVEARRANWNPTASRAGIDVGRLHAELLAFCREPRTVAEIQAHLADKVPGDALSGTAPVGVRNTLFRIASGSGGLVHVPPSGFWRSHGKPRYLDADVWLPDQPTIAPRDALVTSMERYLSAYGPASLSDVGKWVGQPRITRLREAAATLGDRLRSYTGPDGRALLDLADRSVPDGDVPAPARFLSRWDSVIIGYEVRDRILPEPYRDVVGTKNGDFLPTFLVDGWIAGLWATDRAKDRATIRLSPFRTVSPHDRTGLETEAVAALRYVEPGALDYDVRWYQPVG